MIIRQKVPFRKERPNTQLARPPPLVYVNRDCGWVMGNHDGY